MKLGPYDVLGEVGRGGMGVVLRGRAPDGRVVAVKCLLAAYKGDALARFDRERRLLSTFGDEAGFVPLLDFGDSPRGPFIVMPFLGGGTLRRKIANGPMPIDEALALAKSLAGALARAHEQGIVHRDLKPENVLFTDDGKPLVSDLGLAKHFNRDTPGASQSISLSVAGEVRGTAGYMAPEQIDDSMHAGPSVDVFALGAIIYECLTGDPAFEGDNVAEMLGRVVSGNWTPIRSKRPEVPRAFARTIERALAAKAEDRYPNAGAFARALDGHEDPRPGRGRRVKIGAIVLALIAAGVAALLSWRPGTTSGGTPAVGPVVSQEGPGQPAKIASRAKLLATWGSLEWRHDGPVRSVAIDPDGKVGVSGGDDRTVRIWDLATGRAVHTLRGHKDVVTAVALSPDGRRIASSSLDGTVRCWDAAKGVELWRADESPDHLRGVAISTDGRRVGTCGGKNHVCIYELSSGKLAETITELSCSLSAVAFMPGKDVMMGTDDDGSARTYELAFGIASDIIRGQEGAATCLAAAPDGVKILTGGVDQQILYRQTDGKELGKLIGHSGTVTGVAVSGDGKRVLSSSLDKTVRYWDLENRLEIGRFEGHDGPVLACAITRDGKRGISGGVDRTVRLWDLAREKQLSQADGHHDAVTGVAIMPDQKHAITSSLDCTLILWDATTGKRDKLLVSREPRPLVSVALLPKSGRPVTGGINGHVSLWDFEYACDYFTHTGNGVTVASVSAGLSSDNYVIACLDGNVRSYDAASATQTGQKKAHPGGALAVAMSRDGRRTLSAGADGRIALWATESDIQPIDDVADIGTAVAAIAMAGDGHHALSGSADGAVSAWDIDAKTRVTLGSHGGPVVAVAYARSDRFALSASEDGTVQVWDIGGKRLLDRIDLSPDRPTSLGAFSDGKSFLVGTRAALVLRYELEPEK